MSIPYLNGYFVKPSEINSAGVVRFTDGTNTFTPNQQQCEAYGYTYDSESGTCVAFVYNTKLEESIANERNVTAGSGNTIETGSTNTFIMGEDNIVKGLTRNNIIAGNNNQISNGVNNTYVYGSLGESTADNSIVLGGNTKDDILGERQSIQLMYGTQTTAGSTVDSYLNNTTDSYFQIPLNSIFYFHADVIAVRVGGSAGSGAVGDYASFVERGVVIQKAEGAEIQRERDAIKSDGTVTDWRPVASVNGLNFLMTVRGETDTTIEWCSNITITQIKTGVSF
tara:strand:- start:373 stop:1218 length:846 start_codon:yes stop_codon:yes gene_type:complete